MSFPLMMKIRFGCNGGFSLYFVFEIGGLVSLGQTLMQGIITLLISES
jgi:hypothetical protein